MHKPNSNAGRFAKGRKNRRPQGRYAQQEYGTVKDTIAMAAERIGGDLSGQTEVVSYWRAR
jgi:hypothetical protein